MARKYELITDLYYQTINEVSENADSWKSFLKTAGRNFRLRFDEQILIYAQRPDAIAVLEIEKWNNRFGRWVNKGRKQKLLIWKGLSNKYKSSLMEE